MATSTEKIGLLIDAILVGEEGVAGAVRRISPDAGEALDAALSAPFIGPMLAEQLDGAVEEHVGQLRNMKPTDLDALLTRAGDFLYTLRTDGQYVRHDPLRDAAAAIVERYDADVCEDIRGIDDEVEALRSALGGDDSDPED